MLKALRDAGLKTEEVPGWKTRGHGDVGTIKGVLCHHTAGPGPKAGNFPSLGVVRDGRPGLDGPLAQLGLGRDGTFYLVSAGKCYHAGAGYWQGVTAGNSSFIGIEAENSGAASDPWPSVQMDAYRRGVAAILSFIKAPPIMAAGHKEYALPKGRKPDPSFDMVQFRKDVAAIMGQSPTVSPKPEKEPPPAAKKVKVVNVAPDTLAFRDGPGGHQTGDLPEGVVVSVLSTSGAWTKVLTPAGHEGWVASRFLAPV
jgi:hypothetical protein